MLGTNWASRRRLLTVLAAAACLAGVSAATASAAPAAPPGAVMLQNGGFPGSVLCASPSNDSVWVQSQGTAIGNPYCSWMQLGPDGQFTLFNLGKAEVMACTGGDVGPILMEQPGTSPLGSNAQQFSWGGVEDWGYRALQCFYDSGQNVDAKATDGDYPRTDPVHARGWRHGYQRELTWNEVAAQ
ncbi:hypothetical protein [Kutzneria sp. CA-103260]|uniref:hypothetical protein n=1 Tax=Kutzneria sp. CA-103260 TaxID=2802641 RepID=UPI001BA8EE59|nr:hypothetical protein [Kutzneria sp. CA-103260]QUQ67392.1 hypothetical protein JJ691_51260 [Kutzneria sp. CA-103260]